MSAGRAFVDTNILVYLFSVNSADEPKRQCAYDALEQHECLISTQVINEFCNFCVKKTKTPKEKIQEYISQIREYCGLTYVDEDTIDQALEIHTKYGYSYYDSLMISSALESDCKYLLSEDLADGQVIDGSLTIKNIFT